MQAPFPLPKIFYSASTLLIAGLVFCSPVFSAGEYGSSVPQKSISETSANEVAVEKNGQDVNTQQKLEQQSAQQNVTSEEAVSSKQQINNFVAESQHETTKNKEKNIGDHFSSLNPFKKTNTKNKTNSDDSSVLFAGKETIPQVDIPVLIDQAHKVEDLAYGEILLDYYTSNNSAALIRAREAQAKGELKSNAPHVELLLAQLYILEGLPNEAEAALKRISKERISEQTRNRAYFQLARMHLYQGDLDSAKRILENDLGKLSASLELEKKSLLSEIYIAENNKDAISQILAAVNLDATKNAYIKYNIASAAIFSENENMALPLLLELSTSEHVDLESRSLRDQVNLNLGLYYLKQEKIEEAKTYLKLVSYEGPHSSAALYYLAWIELNQNETNTAFALWVDLSKRNPADPFVGKSYLIRPYTLEKLNSSHLALSGYLRASELYEQLIKDVDTTIKIVESESWFEKLRPASLDSSTIYEKVAKQPGWIETQTNEANFLIDLYSSDEFAIIYRNFWEIELLRREIEKQGNKFQVFQLQQETHNQKFDQLVPEAKVMLNSERTERILSRLETIEQEIKSISKDNNFLAAPTEKQARYLEKLNYLKSVLDKEPMDQYQDQRRYLKMLEGIIAWEMNQDMNDRQWKIREQYRELSLLLGETQRHRSQIESGIKNSDYYETIMPKLNDLSAQLELKMKELELVSLKYQKLMRSLALDILNTRKKEYKSLRVRAKLAAARLQDNVVTGGKK